MGPLPRTVFRKNCSRLRLGLLPLLAGGVARIAGGLALGFQRRFAGGGFLLFAGGGGRRFFGEPRLLGFLRSLLGLARELRLGARGGFCFALGLPLLHCRIVSAGLGAKLVQNILSRLLGRFLTVCETDFLESTHLMRLVAFVVRCERELRLVIRKPAQCRAKTDASAADQRGAEYLRAVILERSGKAGGDLAAAEYRPGVGFVIGRVLVCDDLALPSAIPDGIGAGRPEIRIATQDPPVAKHQYAAGPAFYPVE